MVCNDTLRPVPSRKILAPKNKLVTSSFLIGTREKQVLKPLPRVAKWFSDEGVSGTIPHIARPAFKNLLAALYGDGVTTVIVEDVDRLGRDAEITLDAIGDFRRAWVHASDQ